MLHINHILHFIVHVRPTDSTDSSKDRPFSTATWKHRYHRLPSLPSLCRMSVEMAAAQHLGTPLSYQIHLKTWCELFFFLWDIVFLVRNEVLQCIYKCYPSLKQASPRIILWLPLRQGTQGRTGQEKEERMQGFHPGHFTGSRVVPQCLDTLDEKSPAPSS